MPGKWKKRGRMSKRSKRIRKRSQSAKKKRNPIRKTGRTVVGRTSVRGVTERFSKATETKFYQYYQGSTYGNSPGSNPAAIQALVWTSNSQITDLFSTQYNPNPVVGLSGQSVTGKQWYYCGVDLRFTVAPRNALSISNFNNNLMRMLILVNKNEGIDESPTPLNMPASITEPVDSKKWKVHMDKTFPMSSGYFQYSINEVLSPQICTGNYTTCSPMKEFRFKIPWKCKATYPTGTYTGTIAQQFKNEHNIYVILYSKFNCPDICVNDVNARIYFKDC